MTLAQDGEWQLQNVALLDFDNGTGSCAGSTETNYQVKGTVPAGTYTGIKFTMGIPFDLNHGDVATAAAPLNSTDMFWVWNYGYKFLRVDLSTTGQPDGFFLHVGSTGCNGATATSPPTACTELNEAAVTLTGFSAGSDVVVVDLKPVLATTNVDADAGDEPGCMSSPTDPECATIFPRSAWRSARRRLARSSSSGSRRSEASGDPGRRRGPHGLRWRDTRSRQATPSPGGFRRGFPSRWCPIRTP